MIKCVNTNSLRGAKSYDKLLEKALEQGFAGLELGIDPDQQFPPQIMGETWQTVFEKTKEKGLSICSVTTGKYDIFSLGSPDEQIRNAAIEFFSGLIGLAAESGRGVMAVIAAHQTRPLGAKLDGSYEQTFNLLFESLAILADRAEKQSVYLAIETPGSGLWLSPLELRELIDEINNPYLGICLNPSHVERLGNPLDWLSILNRRVIAVHVPIEQASVDQADKNYQSLLTTLRAQKFTGPLVYINRR